MIRWSYLLPRLTILATLLLLFALGLDPLLRWALICAGQAALGAKVEIHSLTTIPRQARIHLSGFQAANPNSPLKNRVEFREANLSLDPQALLTGRVVVHDGSLTGIRFDTDRATSGELARQTTPEQDQAFRDLLEKWLDQFISLLDKEVADQFESVGVARELVQRWPQEYQRLEAEIDVMRQRVNTLRDSIEQARRKPLENLPAIQTALQEATQLRADMLRMRRRADEIQQQFRNDCRSIEVARRNDIERIEQALEFTNLNQQAVSDYLLGPELSPYALQFIDWLTWGKKWLDIAGDPPRPPRGRGIDFSFPRHPPQPEWLIENLLISGETRWGQRRAKFKGVLTGLTSDQSITGEPARLTAQLDGVRPAHLEIVVDHRDDVPVHRLTFDCPAIALGRRALGREEVLLLDVEEGQAQLSMQLEMQGRNILGQIVWRQDDVRLAARLADKYHGPRAQRFLKTALSDATHLHAALDISGTIDDPQLKVNADIGPQLTDGLNKAIVQELEDRRDQLVMKLHLKVVNEVTKLEQLLAEKQREVLERLNVSDQLVQQVQQIAGTGNLPGLVEPVRRTIQDKVERTIDDKIRSAESKIPGVPPNWRDLIR